VTRTTNRGRRPAALVVGLALVSGAGVLGCGLVVGAGDYVVGDAGGGGDAQNQDGGGSVMPTNDGGKVVDSGDTVPVDGGTMPDGGGMTSPDAQGGGPICNASGALIPGSLPSTQDFQKLVNTCVQAVNCDPGLFPANMSGCISNNYLQAIGSVACLSTSQDCNGYYGCQGDRVATVSECAGNDFTGFCDGNVATTCTGFTDTSYVRNCDKLGGTCQVYDDGFGDTIADCEVVSSCNQDDSARHCAGNKIYTCESGIGYGKDCGAINATCIESSGDASCYFNATSCSTPGYTCNNGSVSWCTDQSQAFDYQCSRAGLSCELDDTGNAACIGAGCSTSPTACAESCDADGVTAHVCIGGAPYALDCTMYGFNSCETDSTDGYVFCIY
jgi:hypothetical protein